MFRFHMSLYPDATAGDAYTDMSRVDGKMSLKVGCIQIIYLQKFFMSLLVRHQFFFLNVFLNEIKCSQLFLTCTWW